MKQRNQRPVPKICGADIELGNFVMGDPEQVKRYARPAYFSTAGTTTCYEASRRLLREVEGVSAGLRATVTNSGNGSSIGTSAGASTGTLSGASSGAPLYGSYGSYASGLYATSVDRSAGAASYTTQDWGRKYLPCNGSCIYIDLDHLELAIPEVTSATDHVAAWYAMLRLARAAHSRAQEKMPDGTSLQVLINNSDGFGNSYGSHLSFLMDRQTFSNMFQRKLHYLMFLASYQASSIVFTGTGKVGSENAAPSVDFQLTQRADFFETLSGPQTTYCRPVVNARDEALCGMGRWSAEEGSPAALYARLHVIFYDSTLNQVASYLKVGVMQIVLAMIEGGVVDMSLVLEDPVAAVHDWSHDPTLEATARTIQGAQLTATEHQRRVFAQATLFAEAGGLEGVVPGWQSILEWWSRVLDELSAHDLGALSRHVDWALKYQVLEQVRQDRDLPWDAPEMKHLDQIYSSLDPATGLFWAYDSAGFVDKIVTEEDIEKLTSSPPEDTRAWGRAMLLRRAEPHQINRVDWDQIDFQDLPTGDRWNHRHRLEMNDPTRFTREELEETFDRVENLPDLLDAIEDSSVTTQSPEGVSYE